MTPPDPEDRMADDHIPTPDELQRRAQDQDAHRERQRVAAALRHATGGTCTVDFTVSPTLTAELQRKGFTVRRFTGPRHTSTEICWSPSGPQRITER